MLNDTAAKKKVTQVKKFLAKLEENCSSSAVTIISKNHCVTFAHTTHQNWKIGDQKKIIVNESTEVNVRVIKIDKLLDVIWMEAIDMQFECPNYYLPYEGQLYFGLGFSSISQKESTFSVCIGMISSNKVDSYSHIRGTIHTSPGDSGGPCFDFYTGDLIGISVGNQHYGQKLGEFGSRCHIIPVNGLIIGMNSDV
jgi:hypothetical protein